jgi:hydroxymethylpyrimidine/phosphomethylpyrimidine kinase
MSTPRVALTIAGSDSGGGAGIQADLLTFASLGVHGTSAITALTAQNTRGVAGVHVPPVEFLRAQLDAVLSDLPVAGVKTGMLATEEIVLAVADAAAAGRLPNLVVDPVLVSSTGARLLDPGAESAYLEALLPRALVATPNTREAAALLGEPVVTVEDARAAARRLADLGPRWVVVKGGHLTAEDAGGDAVDVVHDATTGESTELRLPRVATRNDHGTGCTFAAATTALLARGTPVPDALAAAKRFVHAGLTASAGWALGAGHGPVGKLGTWSP